MYKYNKRKSTQLEVNNSVEGELLITKIERVVTNKEPIKDGAPIIYRERNEGVNAGANIRSDRFEIAIDAMEKVAKTRIAKRAERGQKKEEVIGDKTTEGTSEIN